MKAAVLAVIVWLSLASAQLAIQEARGNRAYREGDYSEAAEHYREALPDEGSSARLSYNLGTALLRLGIGDEARERLTRALAAREPELRARAFYNLGNALAREAGPQAAERLRGAVDAYRRALLLEPDRVDAKWNLELALRRLEELEESSESLPGQGQPPVPPRDRGEGEEPRPEDGRSTGSPRSAEREPRPAAGRDVDAPLPRELAEQILRAVEERERGLQREKLRKQPTRTTGPDW